MIQMSNASIKKGRHFAKVIQELIDTYEYDDDDLAVAIALLLRARKDMDIEIALKRARYSLNIQELGF